MNKRVKYTCTFCGGKFSNRDWKIHINSNKHKKNHNKNQLFFVWGKEMYDIIAKELINKWSCLPRVQINNSGWRCKK